MAARKIDNDTLAHLEWLGFVRPAGLVVSAPALVTAGAILNRRDAEGQRLLRECAEEKAFPGESGPAPWVPDFQVFARSVLGWTFAQAGYAGTPERPVPDELRVPLPDYGETLEPHFAVVNQHPKDGASPWQLLVRELEPGEDFDRIVRDHGRLEASAHGRMERLLRHTRTPAGLLFNGRALRLISAPYGESSGWLDFQVADMLQTAGRPIAAALRLLLGQSRLLTGPASQRLPALLESSRKYQNEVSERLAEQVLHGLYELLRGFQAAHDASHAELLKAPLAESPGEVYHALLTVVLRLVFLLYAEERDVLPGDETFLKYYSLAGLYERLREDAALFPDTMDQRYGAWAQLVVLFRLVHNGAACGTFRLPQRHGVLFDPDRYPFLEGRTGESETVFDAPLVPDGTIFRLLDNLLVLDGNRISYRALDVEEIGSVYETMMGFRLETATGPSLAIKSGKKGGAPTTVDLARLLAEDPGKRAKALFDQTGRKVSETVNSALCAASTLEDLHAALAPVADVAATPDLVPEGALVLQPSEERRRSGSHYTPRSLTEPIVRTALEPILARLRGGGSLPPKPEAILDLCVCDPAMGSGAFLVETCRQLGDALIESWHAHGDAPDVPPDEDEVIYARRQIAQRCLYGVDRNPVAVDLAKVSVWLATLARDHAFTFLDHALRHGDSLVGLSRRQIEAFHWEQDAPRMTQGFEAMRIRERLEQVSALRNLIREADEDTPEDELSDLWDAAGEELERARLFGDLVVAAFFDGENPRQRKANRDLYASQVAAGGEDEHQQRLREWRHAEPPLAPFHWELEFPEVFERANPGFDAFVGNPPFAGKNTMASGNVAGYPDWLKEVHDQSHGNSDIVAHFYRRAFDLLRTGGAFGLIATNTIAQGDTRSTGLRWICAHGGDIYSARKRVKWPGQAAVVVSVLHGLKGEFQGPRLLDGREAPKITAFLFHRGGHDDPVRLKANEGKSFQGSIVLGMGFTFDDTDTKGVASPLAEMHRLIEKDPRNQEVIFPYIGGEEVNNSPTHAHHRYVINFGDRSERECRERWPDLMAIVEERVKPERLTQNDRYGQAHWWQFLRTRPELYAAIARLERVLVISQVTQHVVFAFLPAGMVYAHRLYVFPSHEVSAFALLQSGVHDVWARFLGSSLEERFMYAAADCFETFPFPEGWESDPALEAAGREYYDFRAALMVRNNEGLTKTYNRFHDPDEESPDILKLRELHAAMDRAVLDAYGWTDIPTACEFLLDYEDEEEDGGRRKKPWRCRWPDDARDEVLARLLELNAQRAAEEVRSGAAAAGKRGRKPAAPKPNPTGALF